jgi:hypothetical protein
MENIQNAVDRIAEMQRQKDITNRENRKMFNILANCIHGINNDYVSDIKTLDDFVKKDGFIRQHVRDLKNSIPEDRKYIEEKFKGRIGKAKQEDRKKYLENLKDDEYFLEACEELCETVFFEGAASKYYIN